MTTTYVKATLGGLASVYSDYSRAQVLEDFTQATTPAEYLYIKPIAGTGGSAFTLSLTVLTTCYRLSVKSDDANTAAVTMTYKTLAGAATTQTLSLAAGDFVSLVNVDPATAPVFTAASGSQQLYITAYGV